MSGIIPKENLRGYQRWQIGSFDQPAPLPSPGDNPSASPNASTSPLASPGETIVEIPFPTADTLAEINESARAEGYRIGYEEGRAAGEAEFAQLSGEKIQQLSSIVGNLHVSLAHLDQGIAEQLLDLSLEIAAQVIRGSLTVDREKLLQTIREAIAELPVHQGKIVVHLNPDDAETLHSHLGEQLAHTGAHLVPDDSVSAGGCRIVAGNSEVDATIETRWKRVLEAIGAAPRAWLNQT